MTTSFMESDNLLRQEQDIINRFVLRFLFPSSPSTEFSWFSTLWWLVLSFLAAVLASLFGLILPLALLFEENVPVRMNEILQFLHADSYFLLKKILYIDIFRKGLWISILTFFVLEGCCHNLNFSLLNLCLKMLSSISDKFNFQFIFKWSFLMTDNVLYDLFPRI